MINTSLPVRLGTMELKATKIRRKMYVPRQVGFSVTVEEHWMDNVWRAIPRAATSDGGYSFEPSKRTRILNESEAVLRYR
jgi:hypothetical protein